MTDMVLFMGLLPRHGNFLTVAQSDKQNGLGKNFTPKWQIDVGLLHQKRRMA